MKNQQEVEHNLEVEQNFIGAFKLKKKEKKVGREIFFGSFTFSAANSLQKFSDDLCLNYPMLS